MFKKSILIIDTDTLHLDLIAFESDCEEISVVFIWDEDLFEKRFFSARRRRFVHDALSHLKDVIIIEGESVRILEWIQAKYKESHLFYASRFHDRFKDESLKRLSMLWEAPKVDPLPRGFFPFFKKLSQSSHQTA